MRAQFRDDFDPERVLEAARTFICAGRRYSPGVAFEKADVPLRRLRQLFNRRLLRYPGEDPRQMCKPSAPERFGRWAKTASMLRPSAPPVDAEAQALPPIPEGWESLPWFSLRAVTSKLFGVRPANKEEASALFKAEIARRAVAA